jgi:hypothetical protein
MQTLDKQLTAEFLWKNDRYVHRITDHAGGELTSVEGTPEQAWPASPPIQQLSLESINGEPVLLGVGAAGTGHWSISVTSVRDGDNDALKFELACRSREVPDQLASTYERVAGQMEVVAQSGVSEVLNMAGNVVLQASLTGHDRTRQWTYLVRSH